MSYTVPQMPGIYLAQSSPVLPQSYTPDEITANVYSPEIATERTHQIARRIFNAVGIKRRTCVLKFSSLPDKELACESYEPTNWGDFIVKQLSEKVATDEIGALNVSYNASSHREPLPNLSSQIAIKCNLRRGIKPNDFESYGCAGGLISLIRSVEHSILTKEAAIAFSFDQCSWVADPIFDPQHEDFKDSLRTSVLFSDGGIGMLVIPETMRNRFAGPLPKVIGCESLFIPGEGIKTKNGRFLVQKGVENMMPQLVANELIKPTLEKHDLNVSDIKEWSIHQGGFSILNNFKDPQVLGLTEEQIRPSMEMFKAYGNFSAPSCLFVLDKYLKQQERKDGWGAVVSFGAGYHMAIMLYKWD